MASVQQFLTGWGACLAADEFAKLRRLRQTPGVRVLEADGYLWIRGDQMDEAIDHQLRRLAPLRRFDVTSDGQLIAHGKQVPEDWLPQGKWTPIADWLGVWLDQPAGFPAEFQPDVTLRCVRWADYRPANLLLTTYYHWFAYATSAPAVRLARWSFAVDDMQRTLIRGEPVPPVAGTGFVEQSGIACPAGWRWDPPVSAGVLRSLIGLGEGDLALLQSTGDWEFVAADQFVRATRSAVRQTRDALEQTP